MSEAATRYIAVPIPIWEPWGRPTGRATPLTQTPSPEGEGVGGGASSSCQVQEHNFHTPITIARGALVTFLELPKNDVRHRYDQLCTEFVEYLTRCEEKGFMLKGYDTSKGKILNLPMDYDNRWGKRRRYELSVKLKRLEDWFEMQQDRPVTMITLTSYHDGMSIGQAWYELNKSRGKLLKLIGKYFPGVDYFWVPEPHKSGYVHYHLAVFADVSNNVKDNKGKGIEDKFRDLWSRKYKTGNHTYGLDFSQKKDDGKIQHLKKYLSKYLEKGFLLDKWTHGMLLFNAHLWDTGYRMYGASKNIREIMNAEDEKDSSVVWLETKLQTVEETPEGELLDIEKIIWDRQYLPDWIDEPLWYGNGRQIPWDLPFAEKEKKGCRYYRWGRPTIDVYHGQYDSVTPYDPVAARRARALASQEWSD